MAKIWILVAAVVVAVAVGIALWFGTLDRSAGRPAVSGAAGDLPAPELRPGDHVLGDAGAPVTILEYSSLTCPHCARFHKETYPKLKSAYIDSGKVKLVYRDFPLDQIALKAAQLAECMPRERYFGFVQLLFESQANWAAADDATAALTRMGKLGGLSEDQITACFANEAIEREILDEQLVGRDTYKVSSTPSFVIAGKRYAGALTPEQIEEILTPLLK